MPRSKDAGGRFYQSPEVVFGRILKGLRVAQSISQDELAFRSGYSRRFLDYIEHGQKSPSLRTLFNLCSALDVSPGDVIRDVEQHVKRPQ